MGHDRPDLQKSQRLHDCFGEMAALLRSVEATEWLMTIQNLDSFGNYPDQENLVAILGMFGGMGSMSDWVISSRNHHKVQGKSSRMLNDRLEALREEVFDLANGLLDSAAGSATPKKL